MATMSGRPAVAIFGPDPLLSITIEAGDAGAGDEVHIHAAGQGVWVARMTGELGAAPILCCQLGGEVGATLQSLFRGLPGAQRIIRTQASSGSYVIDRRGGERQLVASSARGPTQRHEVDDLVAATCAAAWGSKLLVVCNPYPAESLPVEVYATVVADVKAAGVPVIVDLSSPRLEQTLPYEPDLVKLNDWELAAYVYGPVDGMHAHDAARRLCSEGARAVAVTRAGGPTLVVPADGDPYEIVPPALPRGFREGCGDTMMGAIAAAWVQGRSLRDALVLGAAAGSVNFMRHGLGTGSREQVEAMAERVVVRPARFTEPAAPAPQR